MIGAIILITIISALLDTLFGNRILPSEVRVEKKGDTYIVMKVHRYFFIPINRYLKYESLLDRRFDDFGDRRKASEFSKKEAIAKAMIFSNKTYPLNVEIVWSSKIKAANEFDQKLLSEIHQKLNTAISKNDTESEIKTLQELHRFHQSYN